MPTQLKPPEQEVKPGCDLESIPPHEYVGASHLFKLAGLNYYQIGTLQNWCMGRNLNMLPRLSASSHLVAYRDDAPPNTNEATAILRCACRR